MYIPHKKINLVYRKYYGWHIGNLRQERFFIVINLRKYSTLFHRCGSSPQHLPWLTEKLATASRTQQIYYLFVSRYFFQSDVTFQFSRHLRYIVILNSIYIYRISPPAVFVLFEKWIVGAAAEVNEKEDKCTCRTHRHSLMPTHHVLFVQKPIKVERWGRVSACADDSMRGRPTLTAREQLSRNEKAPPRPTATVFSLGNFG